MIKTGNYYGIVSKCSGGKGGLDVFEWSTENGGNINQFAYNEYDCQLWKIEPVHPSVTSGYYTMRNLNSGLYIAEKSGSAVQSSALAWNITKQSDGTYILQTADEKTLTVENNSSENGADIVLAEYKGDKSQKFNIQCNKDGTYSLFTVMSDNVRCADVFEISTEDGANICQWEYWGGDGQKFILEPAAAAAKVRGDVNADGALTVLDVVMMQKYLLNAGTLTDAAAGELIEDGSLNGYDLAAMKRMVLQ